MNEELKSKLQQAMEAMRLSVRSMERARDLGIPSPIAANDDSYEMIWILPKRQKGKVA